MACLDLFLTMENYVNTSHYSQISHNTTTMYLYSSNRHYQTPFFLILSTGRARSTNFIIASPT